MAAPGGMYRVQTTIDTQQCDISCDKAFDGVITSAYFNAATTPSVTFTYTPKDGFEITDILIGFHFGGTCEIIDGNKVKITASSNLANSLDSGEFEITVTTQEQEEEIHDLSTLLTGVADAIRTKEATTAAIPATKFKKRILNLPVLDSSDATATGSDILSGKTAYVNGAKITGNIQSQAAQTITPGTSNKTIPAGKYLSGTQTIKGDANLKAENIKKGVSIFGVAGSYEGQGLVPAEFVFTSDERNFGNYGDDDYDTTRVDLEAQYYDFDLQQYQTIHGTSLKKYRTAIGSIVRVRSIDITVSDGSVWPPNTSPVQTSGVTPASTLDTPECSYYMVTGENAVLRYPSAQDIEGFAVTFVDITQLAKIPVEYAEMLAYATESIISASSTTELTETTGIIYELLPVLADLNVTAVEQITIDDLHPSNPVMVFTSLGLNQVVADGNSFEFSADLSAFGLSDTSFVIPVYYNGYSFGLFPSAVKDGKLTMTIDQANFTLFFLSANGD